MTHTITVDESERQAILLALAKLSIERPGWVYFLNELALKMDNRTASGGAEMFESFRLIHSGDPAAIKPPQVQP